MNIIRKWKERRQQKQRIRELSSVTTAYKSLDEMERASLIFWDSKQRRLFIEQSLALLMLRNASSWQAFITNCYLWLYYREAQHSWGDFILRAELDAVHQAKKQIKGRTLSRADIQRIRDARRQEIVQSDLPAPKIEGFEFFIVRPSTDVAASRAADPVGQLVAVGHYDPDTSGLEMALWSEVAPLIKA